MPRLFEIPEEVEDLAAVEEAELAYGTSFAFDFIKGDFVVVGGKIPETTGHRAWADRCIKTILTQRYAFLAYSDDFGTDYHELQGRQTIVERESMLETIITEALEADPETGRVYGFVFEWHGDAVSITCTIEPTVGLAEEITVDLNGTP